MHSLEEGVSVHAAMLWSSEDRSLFWVPRRHWGGGDRMDRAGARGRMVRALEESRGAGRKGQPSENRNSGTKHKAMPCSYNEPLKCHDDHTGRN